MAARDRQIRYKTTGGGADLVAVEVLVPRADRDLVLQFAEKRRAKYRLASRQAAQVNPALVLDHYPQLKLIAWNRAPSKEIGESDAFALYERNWRFVDPEALTVREKALIERLSAKFGHGLLLV